MLMKSRKATGSSRWWFNLCLHLVVKRYSLQNATMIPKLRKTVQMHFAQLISCVQLANIKSRKMKYANIFFLLLFGHFGFSPYMKSIRKRAPISAAFSWKVMRWRRRAALNWEEDVSTIVRYKVWSEISIYLMCVEKSDGGETLMSRCWGKLRV